MAYFESATLFLQNDGTIKGVFVDGKDGFVNAWLSETSEDNTLISVPYEHILYSLP